MNEQRNEKTKRVAPRRKGRVEFDDFKLWLASMGAATAPTLHVNGTSYGSAVLTVDFGTPLQKYEITPEQNAELVSRMRKATRDLYGSDVNVRVSNDSSNGVWWASVS